MTETIQSISLGLSTVWGDDPPHLSVRGTTLGLISGQLLNLIVTQVGTGQTVTASVRVNEAGLFELHDFQLPFGFTGSLSVQAQAQVDSQVIVSGAQLANNLLADFSTSMSSSDVVPLSWSVDVQLGDARGLTVRGEVIGLSEGEVVQVSITDQKGFAVIATAAVKGDGTFVMSDLDMRGMYGTELELIATVPDREGALKYSQDYHLDRGSVLVDDAIHQSGLLNISGYTTHVRSGQAVTIIINDDFGHQMTTTAAVAEDGSYSLTGIRPQGLNEGYLHVSAESQDQYGFPIGTSYSLDVAFNSSVAPTGQDKMVESSEDQSYTISVADLGYSDANNDELTGLRITTLPKKGKMMVNGTLISSTVQVISVTDLVAGKLKYIPGINGNGDMYDSFKFKVRDDGLAQNEDTVSRTLTFNITEVNDLPTGKVTISGVPTQGNTLVASNNLKDADGMGVIHYQWYAAGEEIAGAHSQSLVLTQAQVSKAITVLASYTDRSHVDESKLSSATTTVANVNDLPTGSIEIAGIAKQGHTLSLRNTLADEDGLGPVTFEWRANGVPIPGATGVQYTLTAAEVGKVISVKASYTDAFNAFEQSISADTSTVESSGAAGDQTIDLGTQGKLIKPIQVEGKWYYYWDMSGDGSANDSPSGSLHGGLDVSSHDALDSIFKFDINGHENPNPGTDTSDVYRYGYINGVHLALPTANASQVYPQGISAQGVLQNGTIATGQGTANNSSFDELLAIWDASNGTQETTNLAGVPTGWQSGVYWSATAADNGHAALALSSGALASHADSNSRFVALEVVVPNVAPVLDTSLTPELKAMLSGVAPTQGQIVGDLVSSLVTGFSDADGQMARKGIAITGFDQSSGTLYYSTHAQTNWQAVGDVSESNALLLSADADTRLYFVPKDGSQAGVSSPIQFRAWDGSYSSEGAKVNATVHGGASAFSDQTDELSVRILANPVFSSAATGSAAENISTSTEIYDANATVDGGGPDVGITYSLLGADAARFGINPTTGQVSFLASPNFESPLDQGANNVYDITVRAINAAGGFVDHNVALSVTNSNDAPVLADTTLTLPSLARNAAAPSGGVGKLVKDLVGGVTDEDSGSSAGIAVTHTNITNGTLYYSTDGGNQWIAAGHVSDVNALLLAADSDNRVYFQPANGFVGTISDAITIKAWDQTSGTDGNHETTQGRNAFSQATDTISQSAAATPVNTVPGSIYVQEDSSTVISGLQVSDGATGDSVLSVQLSVYGSLSIASGTGVTVSNNGSGYPLLTGTANAINALFSQWGSVTYQPAYNYNGYTSLTMTTTNAGESDTDSVSVYVSPVNDAPSATSGMAYVGNFNSWWLSSACFGYSDPDGDYLTGIVLTGGPSYGYLNYGTGSYISTGTLNAGGLIYYPRGGPGYYDYIYYQVQDSSGAQSWNSGALTLYYYWYVPVVVDLNRDGVLNYGEIAMDVDGDGHLERTAWAAATEGVLVWDKYGDGLVHDQSQYAFSQYGGNTDLEGLSAAFDTHHDGVLDAKDEKFAQFKIWQDTNQNGVSDPGEVRSLADWGLTSVGLVSDGVKQKPAEGVYELGRSTATATDGSEVLISDAQFLIAELDYEVRSPGDILLQGADMNLKLSSLVATHGAVKTIDVTGTGANHLQIQMQDVLHGGSSGRLQVTGNADDTVQINASEWVSTSQIQSDNGHDYKVYNAANGLAAQLLIDQQLALHTV